MNEFLIRLNEVIQVEATTTSNADFLVTHKPFKNLYEMAPNGILSENSLDEEKLYKDLFHNKINNHQFVVIQGTQGCGKSHIIRWMKVRLEQEIDAKKEAIMFISRNHNTLQDAVKQILDSNIFPEEIKNNQIKKLKEASATGLTGDELKKQIIFNFTLEIDADEKKDNEILDRRMRDMLKTFIQDKHIQDKYLLGVNNPIEKIRLKMENSDNNVNLDDGPVFTKNDFNIPINELQSSAFQEAHMHTRKFAEKLVTSFDADKLKEKVARYLNSKVSEVIERSEKFKTTDLKELFDSLRIELKKEGKNLILFIEDLTAFTGLDKAIVEVLLTNHQAMGNEEYCRLISVVGLTRAFYDDKIPNNMRDRITTNILINTSNSDESKATFFQNPTEIAKFAARYINAINLKSSVIQKWVKDGAEYSDLPIYTGRIKTEWSNVEDEGKTLSIYPFNKNALWNLYFSIDENSRTPRAFLQSVLKYLLTIWTDKGKSFIRDEKIFNNGIIRIPSWSNEQHYEQDSDAYNEQDKVARKILLRIWGNRTTEKTDDGKVGDVEKEIFEEFEVSTDIFGKTEISSPKPPINTTTITTTTTIVKPATQSNKEKTYDRLFAEINDWQASAKGELPSHIELREILCHRILNSIDWSSYNVPRYLVEYFKTGNIKIEGQTLDSGSKYKYIIEKSLETKYALIALIGFKYKGSNSWNYDNSIDDYINFMTWLKQRENTIVEFVKNQKGVNSNIAYLSVVSEYYLKHLLGKISIDNNDTEIVSELLKPISRRDVEEFRTKQYSDYWRKTFDYVVNNFNPEDLHSLNMNYFKRMFGDTTTETVNYNFYDISFILEQIKKLRQKEFNLNNIEIEKIEDDVPAYLKPVAFLNYLSPKLNTIVDENKKQIMDNSLYITGAIGDDYSENNTKYVIEQMELFLRYLQDTLNIPFPFDKFSSLIRGEIKPAFVSKYLTNISKLNKSTNTLNSLELITKMDVNDLIRVNQLFINYAKFLKDIKESYSSSQNGNNAQEISRIKDSAKNTLNSMLKIVEEEC